MGRAGEEGSGGRQTLLRAQTAWGILRGGQLFTTVSRWGGGVAALSGRGNVLFQLLY